MGSLCSSSAARISCQGKQCRECAKVPAEVESKTKTKQNTERVTGAIGAGTLFWWGLAAKSTAAAASCGQRGVGRHYESSLALAHISWW